MVEEYQVLTQRRDIRFTKASGYVRALSMSDTNTRLGIVDCFRSLEIALNKPVYQWHQYPLYMLK